MKTKKGMLAIALAAVLGAGWVVTHHLRQASESDQIRAAPVPGTISPDSGKAQLGAEPIPQLSQEGFELPPSLGTGSYTEPAAAKNSKTKDSAPKGNTTR